MSRSCRLRAAGSARLRTLHPRSVAIALGHLVDADRDAQQEDVILPGGDRDAVEHVADKPLSRDRGHDLASASDLELVVENVTLGLQGAAAGHFDVEVPAQDDDVGLCYDGPI